MIELLVAIAILGVLTGITIPTMANFIRRGQEEAALTERDNVQIATVDAMAEISVGALDNAPCTIDSGGCNCEYTDFNGSSGNSLPVGSYIAGGLSSLDYAYSVARDGKVHAISGPLAE